LEKNRKRDTTLSQLEEFMGVLNIFWWRDFCGVRGRSGNTKEK
jgi:hypothetical protein